MELELIQLFTYDTYLAPLDTEYWSGVYYHEDLEVGELTL